MNIVAVSGASGFIGSRVVRLLLSEGRQVRALVEPGADTANLRDLGPNPALEQITVDVCDYVSVARALDGCSAFYHLAAIYKVWTPDPTRLYQVNLEGTTNALLAAKAARVGRIVYTSSIAAVGHRDDGAPSDETVQFNAYEIANPYVLSKYLSERIAMNFADAGLPIVVVNPAFPFGPGDRAPTPTGRIILGVLRGEMPGLPAGGFCGIDVDDVAHAHVAAEKQGRIGHRYILGNHNVLFRDFVSLVARVAGRRVPAVPIPSVVGLGIAAGMELWSKHVSHKEPKATLKSAQYMSPARFFDGSKARAELGMPITPLEESVERAVRFFRDAAMAP